MKPSWLVATICAALPLPAVAQDAQQQQGEPGKPTVDEIIAKGRELYRAPGAHRGCKPAEGNEIVVCARSQDSFRTDSSLDDAIRDGERPAGGVPDAPDVDGLPKGQIVVGRGCFVPPCAGPPAYMIDFDSLPDALTPEQLENVRAAPPAEAAP